MLKYFGRDQAESQQFQYNVYTVRLVILSERILSI